MRLCNAFPPLSPVALQSDFGFRLLPVRNNKKPIGFWRLFEDFPANTEMVESWGSNVGIITGAVSGIVVVDTDNAKAEAWAQAHLPETPWMVLTGLWPLPLVLTGLRPAPRGVHRYYRMPEGVDVRNRARVMGMQLDLRANGGYVVAPGAAHPTGVRYETTAPWSPEQREQLPIFDPRWLEVSNV